METADDIKTRNPLPWILIGAVLAPLLIILWSFFSGESTLRNSLTLLLVPLAGAVAGWAIYAINPFGRPRGWRKSIWLLVAMLVYTMAVLLAYGLAQVA